ncbi:MAG: hypothetical protein OWU84_11920 [Firmicutes bacterium]|nr:hypothetical protein [Bacillota bacterium]
MTARRRWRFRWRRAVTLIIGAYLVYWAGVSVHHILAIRAEEQTLTRQIAVVRKDNRVLEGDIRALHNPRTLKRILTGQAPLPTITTVP